MEKYVGCYIFYLVLNFSIKYHSLHFVLTPYSAITVIIVLGKNTLAIRDNYDCKWSQKLANILNKEKDKSNCIHFCLMY